MRIGFISTRLSGTDGVSLEVGKWASVLEQLGHAVFFCAGELGGYAKNGFCIPQLHFQHQAIDSLSQRAFGAQKKDDPIQLVDEIHAVANQITPLLSEFVRANKLDLLIVENALTIPMNLPLGISLTGLIAKLGIKTIAHHHDFYWERERFQDTEITGLLDSSFPPDLPSIRHVTINSIAQQRLKERRGIESIIVPNVLDFGKLAPGIDDYNRDLRQKLGLRSNELFIVQPTRVIRRKGMEMALSLVHRLGNSGARLFITHSVQDEGLSYWHWLLKEAEVMGIDLHLISNLVETERNEKSGLKTYSLWDVYPQADLITYPSLYEGFGNALLEAVYFKRLTVVNRYPVYNADIRPLGFQFIELDGFVDERNVKETTRLLKDKETVAAMANNNYQIATEKFSFAVLRQKLEELLDSF